MIAWAVVQLMLGIGQMSCATATLYLLVTLGPTRVTVIGAIVTTSLTVTSRLLFAGQRAPLPRGPSWNPPPP